MPGTKFEPVRVDNDSPDQSNGNSCTNSTPYVGCCCRVDPHGAKASHRIQGTADTLRGFHMRAIKILFGTTALLAGLALAPAAQAQVVIDIGVQPSCPYGYYGYAPYQCAPMGYYGPGYFYNGIFLGMGPWGGWGYSHGWGDHRFAGEGGGRYHGGPGRVSYRSNGGQDRGGGQPRGYAAAPHSNGARPSAGHATAARTSASSPSRATTSHATPAHATTTHAAPSGGGHDGGGHGGDDGRH